jgi:hypothetical protein
MRCYYHVLLLPRTSTLGVLCVGSALCLSVLDPLWICSELDLLYVGFLLCVTSALDLLCVLVGSAQRWIYSVWNLLWIRSVLDLLCVTSALDLLCVLVESAQRWFYSTPCGICSGSALDPLCVGLALCGICSVYDLLCVGSSLKMCMGSALSVLDLLCVGSALCWICSVLQQARLAFLNADIYITQPRIYVD